MGIKGGGCLRPCPTELPNIQYTVHSIQYTVYSGQYTVYNIQCQILIGTGIARNAKFQDKCSLVLTVTSKFWDGLLPTGIASVLKRGIACPACAKKRLPPF